MSGISHGANIAIAKQVPWAKYKTYADIGTAQGDLAVQIALANPHLQGIGYDLAECAPIFEEYTEGSLPQRPRPFPMETSSPSPCPTSTFSPWATSSTTGALKRRRCSSAKPSMRSIPAEPSSSTTPSSTMTVQNAFGLMMSLNMLIETPGGFDYTESDGISPG